MVNGQTSRKNFIRMDKGNPEQRRSNKLHHTQKRKHKYKRRVKSATSKRHMDIHNYTMDTNTSADSNRDSNREKDTPLTRSEVLWKGWPPRGATTDG